MHVGGSPDNEPTIKADGSKYDWGPVINLKIAGERVITPAGVTGTQTGDSGLTLPEAVWFAQGYQPYVGTDISGESGVGPSVSIEIITDQGYNFLGSGSAASSGKMTSSGKTLR